MSNMTCDECRQAIAVADLTDWGDMDAVAAHCHRCEACAAVVTDVRDSARRVAELLDGIPAGVPSALVARRAAAAAAIEREGRRRRRRLVYPIAGGTVALALLAAAAAGRHTSRLFPSGQPEERREIALRCLTGEQAATLVSPYLGRDGRLEVARTAGVHLIRLTGPAGAVNEAGQIIEQLDNPAAASGGSCDATPGLPPELAAQVLEQDRQRAEQEAERARQEMERTHQEMERARQEVERARQQAERARQEAERVPRDH